MLQWLGLQASTAEGTGSIPQWGIEILHATQHSRKKKKVAGEKDEARGNEGSEAGLGLVLCWKNAGVGKGMHGSPHMSLYHAYKNNQRIHICAW